MMKKKIKIGDQVIVISGSEKFKSGKVLKINKKKGKLLIKGLNLKFKHIKPKTKDESGKIIQIEAFIHHSNVKIL